MYQSMVRIGLGIAFLAHLTGRLEDYRQMSIGLVVVFLAAEFIEALDVPGTCEQIEQWWNERRYGTDGEKVEIEPERFEIEPGTGR